MITYYHAVQKDLETAEEADLVFQAQEWKIDRFERDDPGGRGVLVLEARWTFAVWRRQVWTVDPGQPAPDGAPFLEAPAGVWTELVNPQLMTVGVRACQIDRMALAQARNTTGMIEVARRQLEDFRNLKPGLLIRDQTGSWGELTKVVFASEPRWEEVGPGGPQSVRIPVRLPPGEIAPIELEWFVGRQDDLGDLDDLVAP